MTIRKSFQLKGKWHVVRLLRHACLLRQADSPDASASIILMALE
jgi:hypothetical protein